MEDRMLSDEVLLALIKKNSGGGGGGTSDYTQLSNLPQINSVELTGNKSLSDLGIASEESLSAVLDDLADEFDATATYAVGDFAIADGVLYKCTTAHTGEWDANDFTATTVSDEIVAALSAISGILDGQSIDSFGDVETALANTVKDVKVDGQSCLDSNRNAIVQITIPTEYEYTVSKVDNLTLKVTTKQNGDVTDETNYTLSGWSDPVNIDDHIQLNYSISGGTWSVETLTASTDYPEGQTWTWVYNQTPSVPVLTFEESENHIGLSAAYADLKTNKQDTLTFDDVPTANSNNPVKSGGVKSAIDAAVASAYHHAGTKTCAELVAGLLVAANEGNVYEMTDSGTTTADFMEGQGHPIKEGDNVGVARVSEGVYKFDLLSGFVDTTNFVQKSQTAGLLKNDGTVDTVEKQPATDNTLHTTDKTVVGAINEHEGDISALKSDLTTLDTEVNGSATTYPYADVITITDAVPANLADCSVKVEPVQDLHGYDKPWVGGTGRQKLPIILSDIKASNTSGTWNGNVYTINGDTIEVLVDSDNNVLGFKINKTHNVAISFNIFDSKSYAFDGSYDFVGESILKNGEIAYTYTFDNDSIDVTNPNGVTQTVNDNLNHAHIYIWTTKTYTNQIVTPMVCLSSETDKSFAPYTNICPISGHTEASVQRDGVNLWEFADAYSGSGGLATNLTFSNALKPNTYVLSCKGTFASGGAIQFSFKLEDDTQKSITLGYNKVDDTYYASGTFTKKIVGVDNIYSNNSGNSINSVQLELGQTATDYEPFRGQTYTIQLGSTIYGGTVDFDSGVLTVDRAFVAFDGIDVWTASSTTGKYIYATADGKLGEAAYEYVETSHYQYGASVDNDVFWCDNSTSKLRIIFNTSFATKADWLSYLTTQNTDGTPLQICYPLATPTTVQLTPEQIQLFHGTNTLYASTGDISVIVNGMSGAIGALTEDVAELHDYLKYSTTETDTGKRWIDGSKVYRIVSDKSSNPVALSAGNWVTVGFATGNLIGATIIGDNNIILQHIETRISSGSVQVKEMDAQSSRNVYYAVVEYTKA